MRRFLDCLISSWPHQHYYRKTISQILQSAQPTLLLCFSAKHGSCTMLIHIHYATRSPRRPSTTQLALQKFRAGSTLKAIFKYYLCKRSSVCSHTKAADLVLLEREKRAALECYGYLSVVTPALENQSTTLFLTPQTVQLSPARTCSVDHIANNIQTNIRLNFNA